MAPLWLVHHFLEESARRFPGKTALVCGERRFTYAEIEASAAQLARRLSELGVRRQDRVAIFLDNSPEAVIALFGILKAQAVFVMLSPTLKPKKLKYILGDAGAVALITQPSKQAVVQEALEGLEGLQHIVWVPAPPKPRPEARADGRRAHGWESLVAAEAGGPVPAAPAGPPRSAGIDLDLATIIYTSGSTGEPKGVMSTHANVLAAVRSITTYLENDERDILLVALPLSFDYGLYQVLMAFFFGGTVVLETSFLFPVKVLEKAAAERVTGFPLVPTMAALLLQLDDLSRFDLSSLRYFSNTAAALPVAYIRKLRDLFPRVAIYSMYGLTECKRVSYLPPEELERRPGSVGIPIPNEEVLIVDEEGNEVPPGVVGELVVRGSNVMPGYWNAPEESARRFRPGRYPGERLLYTGDLFRRDEEGYLYFVARKDDLIKTRGERVSPREVENALCEMEGVVEAAVIAVPDEILGSAIKAFVVPKAGVSLAEKDLFRHCKRMLEEFAIPKYFEIREALPRNPSGKIDKLALKAETARS